MIGPINPGVTSKILMTLNFASIRALLKGYFEDPENKSESNQPRMPLIRIHLCRERPVGCHVICRRWSVLCGTAGSLLPDLSSADRAVQGLRRADWDRQHV